MFVTKIGTQLRATAAVVGVFGVLGAIGFGILPVGSADAACPNEAVRAETGSLDLPDCRAYERVTPTAKNGAEFNNPNSTYFVGDPPRLVFESFATFGGSEFTNLLGTSYEISRSPTGWRTLPLGAPATQFEGTNFTTPLRALGSDGKSLLGLRMRGVPVDGESLYLRHGSSLIPVGPEAPPSSLTGLPDQESISTDQNTGYFNFQIATPDLSHLVFELFSPGEHDYLWPFDKTGEGSLPSTYEYVGTQNAQPFLVGVSGGLGSTELISGCGTSVGSFGSQDTYNAVSADGSVVYFTPWGEDKIGTCSSPTPAPPHTELYARVDGELPSAHTVSISEPTATDCAACQTTTQAPATFQGASEDGSKAFFLTEQELLPGDPGNNLYEYNFNAPAGEKITAVSGRSSGEAAGVLGVVRVAPDGSHVYFVASAKLTAKPNSTGATASPGEPNMYVYDTQSGVTSFVATLAPGDSELWNAQDTGRPAQVTPDGRYLLFTSVAHLTPDDTSTVSQLFRYDADTGELIRISVGQNGFNDNGNTNADPIVLGQTNNLGRNKFTFEKYSFVGQNGPEMRVMSDDGSYIFFESSKGLTPKALDHVELSNHVGQFAKNVYEWHDGEISLISNGRDQTYIGTQIAEEQRSSVHLIGTDATGEDVLFTTTSALVPSDTDHSQDIYDARINGGFVEASGFACQGEACQGPATGTPPTSQPGTDNFAGPDNEKPKKHHKKKHHKKKHHKKKHHKKKHHKKMGRTARSSSKRARR